MLLSNISTRFMDAYLQPLLAGKWLAARQVIENAEAIGHTPEELLIGLIWPVTETIQELFQEDRLSRCTLNLATWLNRSIADQIAMKLVRCESRNRKVLILCGEDETEELGSQITAKLFEADGWTVSFAGAGVPEDEVLTLIGQVRPDLLLMFGTLLGGTPAARKLIDYLREVNSCPDMQVMCCGGIYKRVEGLAEEIGADLYAPDAAEAVNVANANPTHRATPDQQTVGRTRRCRQAAAVRVA